MLTDERWERVAGFIPAPGAWGGRPFADHRTVIEAIRVSVPDREPVAGPA